MNNPVILIAFTYLPEAALARNFLEANGIEVATQGELPAQIYPIATGGVKLVVDHQDAERALELLEKGGYIKKP